MITIKHPAFRLSMLCAAFALLASCQPKAILEDYQKELRSHRTLSYHTHMKIWSTIQHDTINEDEEIVLEKLSGDTLMNGRVWIRNQYGEKYYDGEAVYFHGKDSASIEKRLLSERGIYAILGNTSARAILYDFLDTTNAPYRKCSHNVSTLTGSDEVDSFFVKNEDGSTSIVVYTFYNGGPMPARISWTKNVHDVIARRELTFSKVSFDQDIRQVWETHTDTKLPMVVRHPEPDPVPLAEGAQTKPIEGVNVETGQKEKIPRDKLVVLDFWFIGCKPCMDAIPHVIALRKKYPSDKVAIYGINASDTQRDGIKKYMEKNGINYPVLMAAPDVLKPYEVHGFPTFYILDKSGKVIFSELGYEDSGFEERISKIIDSHQ